MPLRDDRRGRRATIGSGTAPFRPEFKPLHSDASLAPAAAANDTLVHDVGAENATTNDRDANGIATRDLHATAIDTNADDPSAGTNPENADVTEDDGGTSADEKLLPPASLVETQRRSLLEPGAARMTIARPFRAARSAWLTFLNLSTQKNAVDEPIDDAFAENGELEERSFASEVASLLRAPLDIYAPRDTSTRGNAPTELPEPPTAHGTPLNANGNDGFFPRPTERRSADSNLPTKETFAESHYPAPNDSDDSQRTVIHESDGSKSSVIHESDDSQHRITPELTGSQALTMHENADTQKHAAQQNIVVASLRQHRAERVVPLTRLPLRPQGFAITWTADLAEFEFAGVPSRAQRHGVLERLVREPAAVSRDVIARAYHEEDGEGRAIALRAFLRNFPEAGRLAFIEALRVGSDEERAIAVDGLTAIDAREELTPAFADRVDAIAAKAALAYVGTFTRADYAAALSPYIDQAQIDTILKLLAGIVE